jgi:hypothetical protein
MSVQYLIDKPPPKDGFLHLRIRFAGDDGAVLEGSEDGSNWRRILRLTTKGTLIRTASNPLPYLKKDNDGRILIVE